jgi:hypothetical protein
MFDRLGRLLCDECVGSMRAIDVSKGEALIKCDHCNYCTVVSWPPYSDGQERKRTAA